MPRISTCPRNLLVLVWLPMFMPTAALAGEADFAVIPPGPVTDQIRIELRLALTNASNQPRSYRARFSWDANDPESGIDERTLTLAPGTTSVIRAWSPTNARIGARSVRFELDGPDGVRSEDWPIEVISSRTRALPRFAGMWIEPLAIELVAKEKSAAALERVARESVRAMRKLGVTTLILAYAEHRGVFFYPSMLEFFDRDLQRTVQGKDCRFDVYGTILEEAERHGMHVFLGLGRGGDTMLLWEYEDPNWAVRNRAALDLGRRVASELWEKYGRRRSFYGWYLTHEMNDLKKASAYYNPMAEYCHSLAPAQPVLVAPAGTPVITREALSASKVDVFAYQDAVGAGYVPYRYTYDPEKRIAMLPQLYAQYRRWHEGTGKHYWSDLEIWEMNGQDGYAGAYPASFDRVRRQIDAEAPHVEMLTGYAYHGYLQSPAASGERPNAKAREPFIEYLRMVGAR